MGIFDASQSSGGSVNSASNSSSSLSNSWANTAGAEASRMSEQAAQIAFERQKELMQMEMDYNREEAQKARNWQEQMANTIYTRSVNNMREAGINPILAANMGLSGAGVSSGQTASIGGATAPMANTYSEYNSGSHSESYGVGESNGKSWNESTSGLTTALELMGGMINGWLGKLNSSNTINLNLKGLNELINDGKSKTTMSDYTGSDGNGPAYNQGYTAHYDSDKQTYLKEEEVANEGFWEGLYRGLRNMTNAHLGIGY